MTPPRRPGSESGSVPLTMLAALVVGALVATLMNSVVMGQRNTRFDRDFQEAIHGADAAVQMAVTVLNRPGGPSYAVGATISGSGTIGDVDYTYSATQVTAGRWEITGSGSRGRVVRHLEATAERPGGFMPYAAFGNQVVQMVGSNEVRSFNPATGQWDTGVGRAGTNNNLQARNNNHLDIIELFGPTASCQSKKACEGADIITYPDPLPLPTDHIDAALAACRAAGPIETYESDRDGPLAPGTYCFSRVVFGPNHATADFPDATPANPVIIFTDGQVRSGNHMNVNCPGCSSSGSTPHSGSLQIFSTGPRVNIGNHNNFAAVIYAPRAVCAGNPSNAQSSMYGSLVCNHIQNQGGWGYFFDESLGASGQTFYRVSSWREEYDG